jgi:hypothetical protein
VAQIAIDPGDHADHAEPEADDENREKEYLHGCWLNRSP